MPEPQGVVLRRRVGFKFLTQSFLAEQSASMKLGAGSSLQPEAAASLSAVRCCTVARLGGCHENNM